MSGQRRAIRDREVLLILAVLVAVVLIINVVSAFVPGLAIILDRTPLLVVLLVLGTGLILWRALARRRP